LAQAVTMWATCRGDHRRKSIEAFRDKQVAHWGSLKSPPPIINDIFDFSRATAAALERLAQGTGVVTLSLPANSWVIGIRRTVFGRYAAERHARHRAMRDVERCQRALCRRLASVLGSPMSAFANCGLRAVRVRFFYVPEADVRGGLPQLPSLAAPEERGCRKAFFRGLPHSERGSPPN
jgi:hypothetical protein